MTQGTSSDADGQQGFEETDQPKEAPKADQQEEQDFIPLEDTDDSEAESDIEIDLSTPSDRRGARRRRAQQQQRKVPKHCCKSNSKVYDNISVYAPPDSNLIFRCSQKRANWYLSRNLARSLSPTSIHLNFAPAGQGHVNDPYYLEERENKCVVCGQMTEEVGATMLHVVPEQYRKWFPIRLKSHSSHDILVACPECNADWDREAAIVRKEIVKLYKIPLEGVGWIKDQDAGAAKRSAGAVAKKQNVIPAERLQFLERNVYDWWVKAHKNTTADNAGAYKGPDYKEHGELVVAQVWKEAKPLTPAREGWRDVSEFIRTWRKEFLDRIRPEHLSPEWKVDNPV
ncbi:MAG: hypothetical protein J3Q66DRAFT_288031 [Benniella sp.]|nr:MAG: hypothetical protein J3Q66DRAFT_288031 [Benniella sp.]